MTIQTITNITDHLYDAKLNNSIQFKRDLSNFQTGSNQKSTKSEPILTTIRDDKLINKNNK